MDDKNNSLMDKIVSLCKRRGFIFPGSEIYGGLANTYDYGPMGIELLRNIRNLWWEYFVHQREDIVGLEASIISSHKVWDASGHTSGFSDAMIDCKKCKSRYRADHLIEDDLERIISPSLEFLAEDFLLRRTKDYENSDNDVEKMKKSIIQKKVEGLTESELEDLINSLPIDCPKCDAFEWTNVRKFNLLFPINLGIIEGDQSLAYLRGETAQGIFINFKHVTDSSRVRLPFGIAQLGKSFRNEITLGNSIFRTIEFEQGEIEYFFDPEKSEWEKVFDDWKKAMWDFAVNKLSIKEDHLRWRAHTDEERSFYSKKTEDLEYNYPFGFKELWGLAYRADYDLKQHQEHSGKDLLILDPETSQKVLPHVIEPAVGINRLMLMILCDAYSESADRIFLKLNPQLAPYKAAVFPLLANKPELVELAKKIYVDLKKDFMVSWDERGNIGKRYAAQDEIGTPFCLTVDFQTLEDQTVTIRDRDTAEQERIPISDIEKYLTKKAD